MSTQKTPPRLLVIDTDAGLAETLMRHFEGEGYLVQTALSGRLGLGVAQTGRPSLILLATRLDDMAGLDVFRALRSMPRTSHIPVMMLAGRSEVTLQNTILQEGAYDFIEKPIDLDILALRVRNALRRAEREGLTEPRTGLPTDRLIRERLSALEQQTGWYRITVTLDEFGAFRDLYGFVTANEALRFAGNLITQIVNEHGSAEDFVGHHTGTEEFVVITRLEPGPRVRAVLAQRLTHELQAFYNFEERERGYIEIEDGAGGQIQRRLMTAKVTAVTSPHDPAPPETPDDAPAVSPPPASFDW